MKKKLNTIKVDALRSGAEALSIKTVDNNNVRLLKGPLVKLILSKIQASLPKECNECNQNFATGIDEVPLFTCHICKDGSHDCDKYKDFKNSLPVEILRGFVWICTKCYVDPTPTAPAARSQSVAGTRTELTPPPAETDDQNYENDDVFRGWGSGS